MSFFDKVKAELIDFIREHPEDGEQAEDLLMVAKYFERIGDHATNIAEWLSLRLMTRFANHDLIFILKN